MSLETKGALTRSHFWPAFAVMIRLVYIREKYRASYAYLNTHKFLTKAMRFILLFVA